MKLTTFLKTILSIAVVFLFIFFVPYFLEYFSTTNDTLQKMTVSVGGVPVSAEIADTVSSRTTGLSGRESLPEGGGMLFVFDEESIHRFWMKGMSFPIDIIWINSDFNVVGIKEGASPKSFPKTFTPATPSLYVLEVNTGFVKSNEIKIGDIVEFSIP